MILLDGGFHHFQYLQSRATILTLSSAHTCTHTTPELAMTNKHNRCTVVQQPIKTLKPREYTKRGNNNIHMHVHIHAPVHMHIHIHMHMHMRTQTHRCSCADILCAY